MAGAARTLAYDFRQLTFRSASGMRVKARHYLGDLLLWLNLVRLGLGWASGNGYLRAALRGLSPKGRASETRTWTKVLKARLCRGRGGATEVASSGHEPPSNVARAQRNLPLSKSNNHENSRKMEGPLSTTHGIRRDCAGHVDKPIRLMRQQGSRHTTARILRRYESGFAPSCARIAK